MAGGGAMRPDGRRPRLFDMLDEGVVVQGADGTVRDWNAAALRLLALDEAQLTGRAPVPAGWSIMWEHFGDAQGDDPVRRLFRCAHERGTVSVGIAGDGVPRWVTITTHSAFDEEGRETIA